MMSISWQAEKTRRITLDALFCALALMLSYLEVLIPWNLLLPLPGFKPGFANIVTVMLFVWISKTDALIVSILRITVMGLLFGNFTSFVFSLAGGMLAYLALLAASFFLRRCSYLGVSLLSALAHNLGQLLAATLFFGKGIFFSYLPFLCAASVLFGGLTGVLLNLLIPRCGRLLCKNNA